MRFGSHSMSGAAAIALPLFWVAPAQALEMTELFGSWGNARGAYDCMGEPGSEIMPVTIGRDESGGFAVGAYAWLCSARTWESRGAFLTAQTDCGHEGDAEITSERLELAISIDGQLVLVRETGVDVLSKCPGKG